MKWTRTHTPRVMTADDGLHYAVAWDSEYHMGQGYTAKVYRCPLQPPLFGDPLPSEQVVGTSMWAQDIESALRMSIKRFDPKAELPEQIA